jgi:DNA-binding response OmpR family regulator
VPQILVVDDEPSVLEMVGELLTQEGFKVKLAATDVDALSILQREAKQTAVLLADINLGLGVTGIDIARKAVAMSPSLEVVYLTGNPDLLTRVGIDKSLIVVKPFQPADLIGRLKTIMRNKR